MRTLHDNEPTEVIYLRIAQSVKRALQERARRERRSLAAVTSIALEDWARDHGDLPIREREPETATA